MAKSWSIIGAGPVGSMQAVLLAAVFPGQKLDVLDQRPVHQRNHGLQIHKATINDINKQLDRIAAELGNSEENSYNQLVVENIKKTKAFLAANFAGQFVRTKTISNKLQKFAEELGRHNMEVLSKGGVIFHMGEAYKIGEAQLNKFKNPKGTESVELSEAEQMLDASSLIFGADGAHSRVRAHIFNDPEPEKDVIQHLVEIKLDIKKKPKKESSFETSKISSEFMETTSALIIHSVLPTLRRGQLHVWTEGSEGTATLHILVKKDIYDTLLSKNNAKGQLGAPGNPYTRLRQLPLEHGVRSLITEAVRDTIGLNNIESETIKITTIPMHVYSARSLVTVLGGKAYILSGDSGAGLIFIRGVNHGLQSTIAHVSALFQLLHPLNLAEKSSEYEFPEQIPPELLAGEAKLKAMYENKVLEIKAEQSKIDIALKVIESSHELSHTSSKLFSSVEDEEYLYDPYQITPQEELRALLQNLDDELNKIELVLDEEGHDLHASHKTYRSWLPSLDLLANEFDHEIYRLEKASTMREKDKAYLLKAIGISIELVRQVTATQDKNQQKEYILEFKRHISVLGTTEMGIEQKSFYSSMKDAARNMLDSYLPRLSNAFFANKVEIAANTVVETGLYL